MTASHIPPPARIAALILVVVLSLGACSGANDGDAGGDDAPAAAVDSAEQVGSTGRDMVREAAAMNDAVGYSSDVDAFEGGSAAAAPSVALPGTGPRVIKTGDIGVEVDPGGFTSAFQRGRSIADKHGGYVVSTYTEGEERKTGSFTMRMPADRFEEAMADLERIGEVVSESVTGEDVSQEFVDLSARLRHLVAQETVMLRLMERATSIEDTIRVQRELQSIQLDIERLRGRLRYLRNQTDLSTITASISEKGATETRPGIISDAWRKAADAALRVVAGVIVATGVVVPLAALVALVIAAVRLLRPRVRPAG